MEGGGKEEGFVKTTQPKAAPGFIWITQFV
jgi:hypothetical protein